jgi:hypothetical protein
MRAPPQAGTPHEVAGDEGGRGRRLLLLEGLGAEVVPGAEHAHLDPVVLEAHGARQDQVEQLRAVPRMHVTRGSELWGRKLCARVYSRCPWPPA